METDKNYFLVGSFVLLTIVAGVLFTLWLVGVRDNSKYTQYRIHFAESINGLNIGGPVKFRGVPVGKVDSMIIDPADTRLIRVDVSILKTTPVKTDTVAGLKLQGITGAVYIELTGSSPQAADLQAKGDGVLEIPAQTSSLTAIVDMLPLIFDKVSHLTGQVDALFSDKNVNAFTNMMADWRTTSHDISLLVSDRNIRSFNDMITDWQNASRNISALTHNLKENPSQVLNPSQVKGIPAP